MLEVAGYGVFPHRHTGMHDTSAMPASQGARLSPPGALEPLPQEFNQHTSVIKKLDHSIDSFVPSNRIENRNYQQMDNVQRPLYDNNVPFVDDDFSDHDSHYSEDFEDDYEEMEEEPSPDMTKQLLGFATMVSTDIQKYFGRKKGEDDSCDIYEDKWVSTKSGRELYYADLLKIVNGEDGKTVKRKGNDSPLLDISNSVGEGTDNRHCFTGKPDKKVGLGALNDLFEYGLKPFLGDKKYKHAKELKGIKVDPKKFQNVAPMHSRKLPSSFWKEPRSDPKQSGSGTVIQQTNNPPDFSDLLESWRLDRNEFSSSDVSMSPESV